uniref:CASPASE_P20 domain-containing protein n=1 Tax=Globodera pallida TaxID=36090 RepID=A0A183CCQ6_GLOPA
MRALIREYRKLLGEGVYAVFYFVGHGFEANGQCYLLPIGAPGHDYGPEHCLSMDWVMDQFRDVQPAALNLILLDICRKFLPSNLDAFTAYAQTFRQGDVRVYVFSSVGDMPSAGRSGDDEADDDGHQTADNGPPTTAVDASSATGHQRASGQRLSSDGAKVPSRWALSHLAFLKFPEEFDTSKPKFCEDDVEGVSLCVMLSHLQRAKGEIICSVKLSKANVDEGEGKLVAIRERQSLGHVLITRLELDKSDQSE